MYRLGIYLLLIASLLTSGCAFYSKAALPMNPIDKEKLQFIKHVKVTSHGIRVMMLGTGAPSVLDLVNKAVAEADADGMVNLEVTFSEGLLGLFSFPTVTIEGDIVRVASPNTARVAWGTSTVQAKEEVGEEGEDTVPAVLAKEDKEQEIVPTTPPQATNHQKQPLSFEDWKKEMLETYNNSTVFYGWADYRKKTNQEIKFKEWVNQLNEEDYKSFVNSKAEKGDWLLWKWREDIDRQNK